MGERKRSNDVNDLRPGDNPRTTALRTKSCAYGSHAVPIEPPSFLLDFGIRSKMGMQEV